MFRRNNGTKKCKYNNNINKAMIIPDGIFQTNNKLLVTVDTKMRVNWSLLIIYGYRFLINHSYML